MKQSEIIGRIERIFDIEDPEDLKTCTAHLIDEMLAGNEFPTTHPFYTDFISLSFDVLYPEVQTPVELLKRSGFSKEEFERAGFKKLVDEIRQVNTEDAEHILGMYGEDVPSRKRRKVSWGANLIQVKEIEKTIMDPEADYTSSSFVKRGAATQNMDALEWITPRRLEHNGSSTKSPGQAEQEHREANSMKIYNTEEHRKFIPAPPTEEAEENETITIPVSGFERRSTAPYFDLRKIVEDGTKNSVEMNEILEDPRVIGTLFRK